MAQPNLTPAQIAKGNQEMLASESFQKKLAMTLPSVGLTPQRYTRMIASAFTTNPLLMTCSPASITRALLFSAQAGLAPTGRGGIWLVPFKNKGVLEITPIIDYRGAMKVARRSGDVLRLDAQIVCKNDSFEYQMGADPILRHKPVLSNRGVIIAVYAVAHMRDAKELPLFVVLSRDDIDFYRGRSKASSSGPWVTDYDAMAKKTAILRLCNMLPADDDDQRLLALAGAADTVRGDDALTAAMMPDAPNVVADVSDAPDPPATPVGEGIDPETGEIIPDSVPSGMGDAGQPAY